MSRNYMANMLDILITEMMGTIKEPMFYPKQSGDKDFKNLEYKKW